MRVLLWSSLACSCLGLVCCTALTTSGRETALAPYPNPHILTQIQIQAHPDLCAKCHQGISASGTQAPLESMSRSQFALDGVAMCTQCHEENVSHMVGVPVDFPIPDDLPLSEDGIVICLTCHKAHGPLYTDQPWANVTVIDRLLNTEAMRKTYLLRRNNARGELCLVCHDTTKE